jgi:uncharacterized membrane protein YuzA (DUF378 family)
MEYEKTLLLVVQVLLIAGALNWGFVAYNQTDLVDKLTGGGDLATYVKYAVAAAGVYYAYTLYA